MQFVSSPKNAASKLPYTPAVVANGLVFASGCVGLLPDGTMVPGGIREQVRQTMVNVANVLEAAGTTLDKVVKCTVFLKEMSDYPAMNEVYAEMFGGHKPARSAVQVAGLPLNSLVEIEVIAIQ